VYDDEDQNPEVVLLRVLGPTALPTDSDVVASMVDYYKENAPAGATTNTNTAWTVTHATNSSFPASNVAF
jgi:hypothetical protein